MSRELMRRGHTVTLGVRAGTEEKVGRRARREGVDRLATFGFGSGLDPRGDIADVRRLTAAFGDADVVHVHRSKEHWLAAVANRLGRTRRPLIRTRHIVQAVRPHAANRWLYRRATDLVITVSDAIRRQYVASGLVDAARLITVYGGVDADAFQPREADPAIRGGLGAHDGAPLVGMVAGLRVMKGHGVVLQAAKHLRRRGITPRFAFVGEGRWEARIRSRVQELGLADHVALAGFAKDLPAVMAAADVALYVPLESEGMSRVVFEYLAVGRALVASRTGVVPEILHDQEDALLVPAGDADALADALARLLGDTALRARLGAAGRRLVEERYSGARVAERLEACYRSLAAAAA